jgi:Tol biopolymer transport system component
VSGVVRIKMKSTITILVLGLGILLPAACLTARRREGPPDAAAPAPPLIAYLREGNLWVIGADGANARQIASAPEGEAINDYFWSPDGRRCYYLIEAKLFAVAPEAGKPEAAGVLALPPGTTVDRLELGRDGKTVIAHALDANFAPAIFAAPLGEAGARELGVDGYAALAPPQPRVIRRFGELAVSPDARRLLFKEAAGSDEQLFIADVETGARHPVADLRSLGGFEESAEFDGGRHVLEAAWSPDGRFLLFNPAQSCSETGLCYGRLFLADAWGGLPRQLSAEMMVGLPAEWSRDGTQLLYDDGSQVLLADVGGQVRRLTEGNRPKWQPRGLTPLDEVR